MAQQLEYGPAWQNTGYVFTDVNGSPLAPDMITKNFCGLVRELGLPQLTFHGLRHAFATLGLKADISPKVVSEALGHANMVALFKGIIRRPPKLWLSSSS